MSSAFCFNLDLSKILSSGNGLKGISLPATNTWTYNVEIHADSDYYLHNNFHTYKN